MQSPNDCPVCGRCYKTAGWRQSHLNREHPEYLADTSVPVQRHDSDLEFLPGLFNRTAAIVPPIDNQPRVNDPESATRDVIRIEQHPNRGCPLNYVPTPYESDVRERIRNPHPHWPFEDRKTFNLARWFITSGVSGMAIDELLKGDFPLDESVKRSLGSNYTFRMKLDLMDDGLGLQSWSKAVTNVTWNSNHPEPIEFYHRNPIEVAKWLLMQPYFEGHQSYNPVKRFINEERVYSDLFEGKYMWEIQVSCSGVATQRVVLTLL